MPEPLPQLPKKWTGLTSLQVEHSRQQHGPNVLNLREQHPLFSILKEVISEPLFLILVGSAAIYFILDEVQEGIIMLMALGFVSGISIFQENRSRNAVLTLRKLANPPSKVIRDGQRYSIPAEDVVIGDLILLEDGDLIPADAEILEAHDFSVNESILTGESLSVTKGTSSHSSAVFGGTLVESGSCIAKVMDIGNNTKLGQIGHVLTEIQATTSPLQHQIRGFVHRMVAFGAVAFFLVWGLNFAQSGNILHALLHGLTLAMSVLPEEIPVAFSTFMALGAYRLYKNSIIAKSPMTVETLGAATVICTDKTGTLTENAMKLAALYDASNDDLYDLTTTPITTPHPVLVSAMWASEPSPFDPMEQALHAAYTATTPQDLRPYYALTSEYPLSGAPPFMTHVYTAESFPPIIACKGAIEGVLAASDTSPEKRKRILEVSHQLASKGYRVLAVGVSDHDPLQLPELQTSLLFSFQGLVAFYDPPKANISHTVEAFYQAGIQVKMITGDYAVTAKAIGQQVHLRDIEQCLTGEEVMRMSPESLKNAVVSVNLYARMFPEAKLRVIEALKANNEVVAMTGDGVNDGPALKAAHIGIAMGKRGSETAKAAASLILTDDDLGHMPEAIALGRRIYENLKKAIRYIISIHIPILMIVTVPLVLFWRFTDLFSPIHVIFLELIMGPTCSIIFENEPIEANSMEKPPRKMTTSFFSLNELAISILQGLMISVACLSVGFWEMTQNEPETIVRTTVFSTLIFSNLFLTLVNRSFYFDFLTTLRYPNYLIPLILVVSLLVLIMALFIPSIRDIFDFAAISGIQFFRSLLAAACGVLWIEVWKMYQRKKTSNTH
ncbi:MAG TPA: haloacid dehalogenase [Bacteroidetes bacterium]|nr:haloacid dehalogenase [Bacteroidota bacterium]HRR07408.1 cation-translocating P-type ATPase [Rhodothermales bacterium]